MKTLQGKTLDEVREMMIARLDPTAYTEVGGASYLTDINPAHLKETLTEAFGLCGVGWRIDYDTDDLEIISGGRPEAVIKRLELYYALRDEEGQVTWSSPVIGQGGSDNKKVGDAVKGAFTSALSKAASNLLWQIDVYKGEYDHKQARRDERNGGSSGNGNQSRSSGSNGKKGGRGKAKRPMKAEDARRAIAMKVAAIGEYNASDDFRNFVRGMLGSLFGGQPNADEKVHSLIAYITNMTRDGEFVTSSKDLSGPEIKAIRDWLSPEENDEGKITPSGYAFTEGMHMLRARLEEMGQETLV